MITIFTLIIVILIIIGAPTLGDFIKFKKSYYDIASGNSFIKTRYNKGNYGEFLTFVELEKTPGHKKILSNVYIPRKDGTMTEADLVMVATTGIYVFESKNYSGKVYGNERHKNWTQVIEKKKYQFFNPIWQNKAHINALKYTLDNKYDNLFKSYIVFSKRCTLGKITLQSNNVKVLKRENLLRILSKDISESKETLSKNQVNDIYSTLRELTLADSETKIRHIESVKSKKK